ncbi:cytosine permease [Stenomitos frigidus]|uniref:Cytosine permease n=1 Tax=Stenomitos frigidus ULC18 TaxID=2107698 RepID=A0A2T1E5V9_9CYAN|nr:cytosine permease [Stenomitos frigidus]PSB28118.1 cytosine permease [Stenomitos frigidus ULC18]
MSATLEPKIAEGSSQKEDYPLSTVPLEARRSIWSLAPLLMGFAFTSTTLIAGGQIGPGFKFFPDLILLIVIGNLVLGGYCAALGYIAQKSGLATVLMARFSFGSIGSRWVDFILGITQIGWYAVTNAFVAQALNKLIGLPESLNWLVILIFTYGFCATAYFGYKAMDWLSRLAVPAMLVLLAISLGIAVKDGGSFAQLQAIQPTKPLEFSAGLAVVIGTFISGGTQATNWSRFADTGKNAISSTLFAFLGINGILVFAGAFCTLVYGSEDIIQAMAKQGLLFWGLILLILNVWTTQDNTIYAFSMAGANFFRTTKRTLFVLGGSTFAYFLALSGIYSQVIPYLIFLGSVIPPVGGIIMVDFWLKHRSEFPSLESPLPAFNWAGIIAYVVAATTAFVSGQLSFGVPPINGIIVAAALYALLVKVMPERSLR